MRKSHFLRSAIKVRTYNVARGKLFLNNYTMINNHPAKHMAEQFVFDFENKLTNQPSSFNKKETW